MDAMLRNGCEREIIHIINEVASSLNIDLKIESEAYQEGGLKDIWKLLGKNSAQITLILAVITVIISRVPVENKELTQQQLENLKLDNELKKIELNRIKKEVNDTNSITDETVNKVIEILEEDYKIIWHKSNFYKKINSSPKITQIEANSLDFNNKPTTKQEAVVRKDFSKFILHSDKLPPIVEEEAVIEIISPVLKQGNFKWKGYYKDEIISFYVKDEEFKKAVRNKEIEFINGIAINCVLHQTRKIDESGIIKITGSNVITVLDVIRNFKSTETKQGAKHRKLRKLNKSQLSLNI